MPEYRRAKIGGGTYFFTVCAENRQPILTSNNVREAIVRAISNVRKEHPFEIDAWVILPDHLHCIWTLPPGDQDFSKRWSKIKRLVTQGCRSTTGIRKYSRLLRNEGALWQRRFWEHLIGSEKDYQAHVDYIHWNSVKHGHVSSACSWRYSSFYRYVMDGIYESDWGASETRFVGREFGE